MSLLVLLELYNFAIEKRTPRALSLQLKIRVVFDKRTELPATQRRYFLSSVRRTFPKVLCPTEVVSSPIKGNFLRLPRKQFFILIPPKKIHYNYFAPPSRFQVIFQAVLTRCKLGFFALEATMIIC